MGMFLFTIGFLGGIVFLIKFIIDIIKKRPKKVGVIGISACSVLFVMGAFMASDGNNIEQNNKEEVEIANIENIKENKNKEKKKEKSKADSEEKSEVSNKQPTMTLEEKVESIVSKKADKKSDIKISTIDDVVAGDGKKIVQIKATSNAGSKLSLLDDASYVFKEVFGQLEEVSEVNLTWEGTFVDPKGNETLGPAMRVLLKKDNAKDINWDNFDINNLEKIANQYWQHKTL